MRKLLVISFLLSGLYPTFLSAQQTPKRTYHSDNPIGYLEYLPPNYHSEGGGFPVIIFLHGVGEVGNGSPESLEKVKTWGPPSLIEAGVDMCFIVNGKKECFIVISPQFMSDIDDWSYPVSQVIDHILKGPDRYRVDPDRIYLTGLSRGGRGVYQYASSIFNSPNKLAAIAPVSAWWESDDVGCIISARKIPVWAFHGKDDTVVPYSLALVAFNSIKYCTNPEPTAEMIFTTYEEYGKDHDSWLPAYDTSHIYQTPNLYEWLLLQSRDAPVTGVTDDSNSVRATFRIYPNPSRDDIYISFNEQALAHPTINIRSLTGELIMNVDDESHQIDISDLSAGVYIVQLVTKSGTIATGRLIKIR